MFNGDDVYTHCVAITELTGGENTKDPALGFKTVRTITILDGNEYTIKAHKIWPGVSGPYEKFQSKDHKGYWVVAITDPAKDPEGIGIFYVPPGSKGLSFSEPYKKVGKELMGAYGYAYDFHLEKIMRYYKIVQMWLGGYGRNRPDLCQGLYGPFK